MDKAVLFDLANETVRRYDRLHPDFAEKMVKRIRRKFRVRVAPQEISGLVDHYNEIYNYAKSVFSDYLKPQEDRKGKYANPSHVDGEGFLRRLVERFPDDDRAILDMIAARTMYAVYLS